jgi:hypothetical protein
MLCIGGGAERPPLRSKIVQNPRRPRGQVIFVLEDAPHDRRQVTERPLCGPQRVFDPPQGPIDGPGAVQRHQVSDPASLAWRPSDAWNGAVSADKLGDLRPQLCQVAIGGSAANKKRVGGGRKSL